jgi:hypothetical protein
MATHVYQAINVQFWRGHSLMPQFTRQGGDANLRNDPHMPIPLNPCTADEAPAEPKLTPYDREHAVTYLRLLDAAKEGADWREVSRVAYRPGSACRAGPASL